MLTLAVLGPVLVRQDGNLARVPGGRTTELLVRLAVDVGTPVRAERLLDELWPGQAHAGLNSLQSKVSRLRRALGDQSLVHGDANGYTLVVQPEQVDAVVVVRLAERAAALRAAGDPRRALEVCEDGLALFHGDVLPGAADAAWAGPYRARLEATRLGLTEDRLAAKADLGEAEGLVAELEDLVAAYPHRERLWTTLISALYRAGRQGDALGAARRVRRLLSDELGVDPGPDLRRLEERVLAQDPSLLVARSSTAASARAGVQVGNLSPLPLPSLVGRQREVEQLEDALTGLRLVTLAGPAGVGKTRLAVEVARQCQLPGGAWLARLETATDVVGVWRGIGEALALDAPTEAAVISRLAGAELLLVLDNCEHLVDAATAVVTVLLSSAPGVRVLVTSQAPLRSRSESVITLEPLNLPDSVTLFATRAEHQRPQQPEDHETGALVEELCRALDGLPLAIELAAARTRVLPVHEIARRLQDRFTLLRDPTSHLPARQSTLRAAVEWSYDLLFPDDQRGLWALSTFAAGASLSAMEAVLEALDVPPDEGLDIITRLVDRSLASAEIAGLGDARYHLLNSVRALSLERLDESGLADVAWAAQVEWLVQAADRAREGSRGPEQARHLAVARGERATIDAALEWCVLHDPGQGVRLALGFGWTWVVLGAGVEAAERVRTALAAAAPSAEDRAAGLTLCGWFEASGGNLDRAEADLREAMRLGDNRAQAVARLHLSFVHTQGGRAEEALALLDTCRDDLIRFGLAWEEGASWLLEAWARTATGDVRAAQAACARAMTLVRPLGDSWAMAHAEGLLGELAQAQHRFPEATRHLAVAANAADTLGFEAAQAHHLLNLGRALYQAGDHSASLATLQQAVDIGQRCGDARTVAFARTRMAQVLRTTGETAAALEAVSGAAGWFATAGRGDGAGLADYLVAALHGSTGAPSARVELSHVLDRARAEEDPIVQVLALDSLAALAVQDGDVDGGLAVLATADQLADRTPSLWSGDRLDGERLRRECQFG